MKELSIEEKAKAYDEAIEKLRSLHDNYDTVSTLIDVKEELENIFPELKESEDEKIRKEMIETIKKEAHDFPSSVIAEKSNSWLSWLEKQGEQRPVIVPKFMVGDFIKLKDSDETYEVSKIEIFDTDEIYYHLTNGGCVGENADNFELVEQKPQGKSALEAAKEEKVDNQNCVKPADKVEPKFKVGDTVKATEDGEVFTIKKITKDKYIYTDDSFDWIKDQDEYELVKQKPTDEEMKELLHTEYEKGRADAIEEMQKPWSEEDIELLDNTIKFIEDSVAATSPSLRTYGPTLTGKEIPFLKALKDRVQPKQEWSEEDEDYYDAIIAKLEVTQEDAALTDNQMNFLKSLKGRIQPQPKQEWSQNDIDMIDWLIRCCEKEHEELCNDKYGHQDIVSDLKRDCRKKWNWLESLKNKVIPQSHWKPSEEQMSDLWNMVCECRPADQQLLQDLYYGLKTLRGE